MLDLYALRFDQLPEGADCSLLFDALPNSAFMLCHDLKRLDTFIVTTEKSAGERIGLVMKGARLSRCTLEKKLDKPTVIIPFISCPTDADDPGADAWQAFNDMYGVLKGTDALILVSFTPATKEYLVSVKDRIEHALSSKEVRRTTYTGGSLAGDGPGSTQADLYYGSEERGMLLSMVGMISESMMQSGMSYRVSITISDQGRALQYLKSRACILESFSSKSRDISSAYLESLRLPSVPFSRRYCAAMLNFSDRIPRKVAVQTALSKGGGELCLGTYVEGSLYDTKEPVMMPLQNLNLGVIITGLPGTGKSLAAMGLVKRLLGLRRPMLMVVSPTEEWNALGRELGLQVIKIYGGGAPFNFFKCSPGISKERFYENLAMLIASASGAGPYRGPMEKCLLAAFRKVYSGASDPDPALVYRAIEEAVIERHAKRSNTGVKYTKHGENIMAGLESLRLMLFKRQFAYSGGTDFLGLLKRGAIFDLSRVSNSMKPFFYALILNQAYGFADALDIMGDSEVRMLLCIEEAHLIFDNTEQSAASQDLRQRIQDFRKKGICLMLLTHSVNDISISIRRLCQTKLYFRQSADSVKYAVGDLVFRKELQDSVADKLKTLEQRVCAASYMTLCGGSKEPASPIFLRSQALAISTRPEHDACIEAPDTVTIVRVFDNGGKPLQNKRIELAYIGEKVFSGATDDSGAVVVGGLLSGKQYTMAVLGEKKKDTRTFMIQGSSENLVKLE